jgi:hypothetical protein
MANETALAVSAEEGALLLSVELDGSIILDEPLAHAAGAGLVVRVIDVPAAQFDSAALGFGCRFDPGVQ